MAGDQLTLSPVARPSAARTAVRVAAIYVAARVVTTLFLFAATELSGFTSRMGADARLGDTVVAWDGTWYWLVAVSGYPSQLPLNDAGQVAENAWAFLPVYPWLAQWVSLPFGLWHTGALIVSLVAGYGASVALYYLLRMRLDESATLWAVAFFASGPLAALFHVGYAEALNLFWLFCALLAVARRRYVWLYALIPLMAFTRPGVLAFALFLALFGIWRWFTRAREPLRAPEIAHIIAAGLLAAVAGFAWQFIAGWVTGNPDAYLVTEMAWRRNWILGDATFTPFEPFLAGISYWFETMWHLPLALGYALVGGGLLLIAVALIALPQVRRLGIEIRLWSASYLVYLLLVFFPQSSIFRLLVPLSPLWGAFAVPRSRAWRIGVLIACLVGQWWWIYNMYALGSTNWQVP
ncbi:hypothetical protein J2X85_003563 [Microbacterium trichothecenolyticum]|uniref:hypothetical protein n=1 Tax=Microbacterium trichothecenolyticum TaxID=69370 RepID=UPI0028552FEE|nr:hypothetical protein [Microbacterium trichothecenolyticum]MDR7186527.1 hypothetical protein [Microbacterium trichothecenolyticum]